MEYVLTTDHLCKNYGHFKALNQCSMHVPRGAIYGFAALMALMVFVMYNDIMRLF